MNNYTVSAINGVWLVMRGRGALPIWGFLITIEQRGDSHLPLPRRKVLMCLSFLVDLLKGWVTRQLQIIHVVAYPPCSCHPTLCGECV